jgi:hypothetical protein
MEKLLVGGLVAGMAAFIAVFMVVVMLATFFIVLAATAAIVWLLVAVCKVYCKPVTADEPDPSPLYLRRWTTMRRWDAQRELTQWQGLFDSSAR